MWRSISSLLEQAVYNRPRVVDRTKHKEGKDVLEAYQLAQRLQSMVDTQQLLNADIQHRNYELTADWLLQRTRKRRVRDVWGNWCDAKDLEGQTYEVRTLSHTGDILIGVN